MNAAPVVDVARIGGERLSPELVEAAALTNQVLREALRPETVCLHEQRRGVAT